jgi:transcriptional regulator with XRE-family HTH domain
MKKRKRPMKKRKPPIKKRKLPKSPLAQLREGLGKNQLQFAELIGGSKSLVSKMERGTKHVTKELALELMLLFGCDPESIQKNKGRLKHLLLPKHPLPEQMSEWKKKIPIIDSDVYTILVYALVPKLLVLTIAAASDQRGLVLLARLDHWIEETVASLKLEKAVTKAFDTQVKAKRPAFWEPLIRSENTGRDHEITFAVLSDETIKEMQGKAALLSSSRRGISQVKPDKLELLVDQLAIRDHSSITKPKSPAGRSTKRFP